MIKVMVQRGYNMRFHPEPEFEVILEEMSPGEELVDGDVIPYYYQDSIDHKFYEYYGYVVPNDLKVYQDVSR
jgi:hypothetical protein